MGELSGERVVGKRRAPVCIVVFKCEECDWVEEMDAYKGPPSCLGVPTDKPHPPSFMKPLRLTAHPGVDIGGF